MAGSPREIAIPIYILEVLAACLICYLLYLAFPGYKLIWALIFVPVVLSPIRDKSRKLALSRIEANFLGASVGFLLLLAGKPALLSFCLGAAATILICHALSIVDTARSALLTLVTVAIPQYTEPGYVVAAERILFVTTGCLIALLVVLATDRLLQLRPKRRREETT